MVGLFVKICWYLLHKPGPLSRRYFPAKKAIATKMTCGTTIAPNLRNTKKGIQKVTGGNKEYVVTIWISMNKGGNYHKFSFVLK